MPHWKFFSARSRVAAATGLVILTVAAVASAKLAKAGPGSASFKASAPGGMTIEGTTSDTSVSDDGAIIVVSANLTSLTTGISLRDKHTKDALEVDKYPSTELRVARAVLKMPADGAESTGDARGSMKLHGQTKDVTFHYTAKNSGGTIAVSGTTRINMTDFGITPPSYLGVGVKPDVDVATKFSAKD